MGEYHCFYVHMNIYACQKNWEKAASEKKYGIIGLRLKGSESASWWMGCFNEWDVMKGRHAFKDINILIGLFWRGFHLHPRCFPLLSLGWHKHYQGALAAVPPHRCGGLWKPWQKSPLFSPAALPCFLFVVIPTRVHLLERFINAGFHLHRLHSAPKSTQWNSCNDRKWHILSTSEDALLEKSWRKNIWQL